MTYFGVDISTWGIIITGYVIGWVAYSIILGLRMMVQILGKGKTKEI